MKEENVKIVARNRKARHEYFIEETIEAGIVLKGTEVKSVREGRVNIKESYGVVENGEVFIYNMHISPYEQGNIYNTDPLRKKKLLLHKREIRKLESAVMQKGYTLVPLSVYINEKGIVKVELAVARGKKLYDKREAIAKRDAERRMQQHLSEKYKYNS
ncbi:SsrA-binding protein [Keratinibaculum paraultunense]|uniref:SsrA-binding protein n=1 Tax=Keratinibaculum paraultunense TaxID=1278232 RepID=A0A4R3KTA1_9FIRM|nr:SsrA-binding protein SmpB [Keratinibaculum paraultunense]QQY78826.1 SsrA-binding protein SmpB [Keratinibaculum paraultunense]TCS87463.1 SsrA-binding protein [Keratinibaculum paraultunense]